MRVITPLERIVVRVLLVAILLNTAFLGWKYYEAHTIPIAKSGGTYTEALVGTPQYINPILLQNNDTDRDLAKFVYSGLLRYNQDTTIAPDLAERYEVSEDGKVYTFHLRAGVQWHDGTPFTADDVLFTIGRIQDPIIRSPLYISFKDIVVAKKDDATVTFTLPRAFAPFLDLATIGVLPKHLWQEIEAANFGLAAMNLKPVGTGPWKYKALQRESDGAIRSYTMDRNDQYYGSKAYLQKIVFKFYPDTDSAIQALKNRTVEGISFLPRELRDRLQKDKDLRYYTFNVPQNTAIFFNQSRNTDLRSKAVRQALALTIDRDGLVRDVLAGEGRVIHAPILPGFFGYHEKVKMYNLDRDRAKALLEAAGYKQDEKGQWYREEQVPAPVDETAKTTTTKTAKPKMVTEKKYLSITLVTVNQSEHASVAEAVKNGWLQFGVSATVELVEPGQLKTDVIDARNYEALLYGEIVGADPDLYPFWHSSQSRAPGLNLALFTNANADKLLEQGRQTTDPAKRLEIYQKFQDILAEEVPAVFLYNPSYNYVVASVVQGITDRKQIVYPSDRFVDLSQWYEKTRRQWK